jgi:hypothetical protein
MTEVQLNNIFSDIQNLNPNEQELISDIAKIVMSGEGGGWTATEEEIALVKEAQDCKAYVSELTIREILSQY